MATYIQVFSLVVAGLLLLWFGYTLFFDIGSRDSGRGRERLFRQSGSPQESYPGAPQTCPVCSARLRAGELVSSSAFPSLNGGKDRMMYIKGCIYCLSGERERFCPVCGAMLNSDEVLICRMFERPLRRPHVHVIGCSRCRRAGR